MIIKVFFALLKTDLKLLLENLKDKVIDSLIWGGITLAVMAHIMPLFGLKNFGVFQAASIIISVVGFEMYHQLYSLAKNVENRDFIFYLFTTPVPSWLIFLEKAVYFTINGFVLSLIMIPTSKIILLDQMDLFAICWPKLLIAMLIASFFFSCFTLFLFGLSQKTDYVEHLFMRLIFPLWFLGGFQFSWYSLYKISNYFGYIALISPHTYSHEAARVAMMGQEGFLPFWLCIWALFIGAFAIYAIGYLIIKKRLDLH